MDPITPAFTVASALQTGITRERLRSLPLEHPFHGMRAPVGSISSHLDLCYAYSVKMRPHTVFTAISAATIWGLPLPAHLSDSDRVSLSTALPARAARGRGVVGRSHDAARVAIRRRENLRVLAPADTWLSLAGLLEIGDLIAVGDAAVTPPFGETESLTTLDELRAVIDRNPGVRGVELARRALDLVRVGSLSRPESLYRYACVAVRMPEPIPNHRAVIRGRPVMLDGAWPRFRTAWDYEGDHHRDREQFRADLGRASLIREEWALQQIGARELFVDLTSTLRRSASMLAAGGWIARAPVDLSRTPRFTP